VSAENLGRGEEISRVEMEGLARLSSDRAFFVSSYFLSEFHAFFATVNDERTPMGMIWAETQPQLQLSNTGPKLIEIARNPPCRGAV
jgi:hypothetical protein